MDILLIDPAGPTLHVPVNPPEIKINRQKAFDTANIVNIGEVDFPFGTRITEISWSSFFPAEYDPSYCQYPDIPDPQDAMQQLTAWMGAKTPVRLIITETQHNILVLVSAHASTYKGGEPGDLYYDITLRVWREIKVRTEPELVAPQQTAQGQVPRQRPDLKPVPKVYVVRTGDSLWKIAQMELGDGNRWKELWNANSSVIGPDPNTIKPGQQLVMPA